MQTEGLETEHLAITHRRLGCVRLHSRDATGCDCVIDDNGEHIADSDPSRLTPAETSAVSTTQTAGAFTPSSVAELDAARANDPEYLNRRDGKGLTVFHRVITRGDATLVARLLELGADPSAAMPIHTDLLSGNLTPLDPLGAAMLGRAGRLKTALAAEPKSLEGGAGSMALYFAAAFGHLDCVTLLLDAKVDPNARIPSWDSPDIGPRPLEAAAESAHIDIAKLLIARGANPKLIAWDDAVIAKCTPEMCALLGLRK